MSMPKIEIKSSGIRGEVFVDGIKLKGIKRLEYSHDPSENDGIPVLKIELVSADISIDTNVIPKLPELFKPFYEPKKIENE